MFAGLSFQFCCYVLFGMIKISFLFHWQYNEQACFTLQFHFDQSKVRSEIRLREGRTKPIDVLYKQLNGSDDFDIEINEPYMVFKVASFYALRF